MPIRFQIDNAADYSGAFLPPIQTLESAIATLPGLVGAWDAADFPATGPWLSRVGTGQIVAGAGGTPPSLTIREQRDVVHFTNNSKAWVRDGNGSDVLFSNLMFASRAFYSDIVTNFQKVFDFGVPEFFFRSVGFADEYWQFSNSGNSGTVPIADPIVGWHQILFTKNGADAAQLAADGADVASIETAGTALANVPLQLGDAGTSTSAECDISRLIICTSGVLTPDQRQAVSTWING